MYSLFSNRILLFLIFAYLRVSRSTALLLLDLELANDQVLNSNQEQSLRVIGGENATEGEFPFMVSLQMQPLFGERYHYCGGTVVEWEDGGSIFILTAAHCVYGRDTSQIQVVAGAYNLSNPNEPSQQRRNVLSATIHPNFNPATLSNDIALISLTEDLVLNERVQTARLPPITEPPPEYTENCTIVGWGSVLNPSQQPSDTQLLEKVNMTVVDFSTCESIYQHILPVNATTMICARGADSNKSQGPCTGDSGGPLICPLNGNEGPWVVAGILTWSMIPCADPSWPSIFTNLYAYN